MRLSNTNNYTVHTTLYSAACTLITNSIIQGFLLQNGMAEQSVMYYLSTVQAVQVCVMFLFSLVVDKLKCIMRLYALTVLMQITMFVSLIAFCLIPGLSPVQQTVLIFSAGILTNIDQALLNILTFKAPYYYLDMNRIGNIQGFTGALCGISGAVLSALLIFFTARFDYNSTMMVFYAIGILLILVAFLVVTRINATPPQTTIKKEKEKKINLFKYKPFYILILPNLMRGFNSGIFVSTMTIGFALGITDKSSSATLSLIMQSAYIIGNFVFSRLSAPKTNVKVAFLSSIALVLFMPSMMSGSIVIFYLMYFLASICVSFVDAATPCVVVEIVDFEFMGQFSSYRMLLHTLGITISGLVAIPLLNLLGGVGTMLFSALLQLTSAAVYYLMTKSIYKSK